MEKFSRNFFFLFSFLSLSFLPFFSSSSFIPRSALSIDFPDGDRRPRRIFPGEFIVAARSTAEDSISFFLVVETEGVTGPRVGVKAKVSIITPLSSILLRPRRRQKPKNLRKRTWLSRARRAKSRRRDKRFQPRLWKFLMIVRVYVFLYFSFSSSVLTLVNKIHVCALRELSHLTYIAKERGKTRSSLVPLFRIECFL